MTTTETPAPAQPVTTCPPSEAIIMVVPIGEVHPGEIVLWDGEYRRVEHIHPMDYGNPAFVLDGEAPGGCIPAGTYIAVRRYTEGEHPEVEQLRAQLAQQIQATRDVDDLRMAEIRELRAQLDRLRPLAAPAFDEAAADRDERARYARSQGHASEEQEHTQQAGEYRAARDELMEAVR